jgi:hypothetical protein
LRIGLEAVERGIDAERHLQRHGVDGLGPVEADHAGRALAANDEVALFRSP